jgi:hypothetical protein
MKPYRQGDILFVPVPRETVRVAGNRSNAFYVRRGRGEGIIVAEGEATGHHHRIRDTNARLLSNGVRRFVRTGHDPAIVSHEEHDDLALPGDSTFEIVHQREHQPARRQPSGGRASRSTQRVWD